MDPMRSSVRGPQLLFSTAAVLAALLTIVNVQGMPTVPGTMGIGLWGFLAMWSVMMTAMMLPSLLPMVNIYVRSLPQLATLRSAFFVGGYLLIWSLSGFGTYVLALSADRITGSGGLAPRLFAAGIFALTTLFYLTPLKHRLLGYCRNPIGLLIHYGTFRGRSRDLRAGFHHGLTCLGCCWSLMALMAVFGMMNVIAMAVIASVVALEKIWARGDVFATAIGVTCGILALTVMFVPELAVRLTNP
jgi:predicted metal-binding membrane protein